jgi:D-proline reductase (dithiol) PrdB
MPFAAGSAEYRELPATLAPGDMLMSHISINFDRIGFQRDVNVVYPIDRMRDLARAGLVGAVADTHYSVMDSTDPQTMTVTADAVVGPSSRSRSTRFCSALSDPSARAP